MRQAILDRDPILFLGGLLSSPNKHLRNGACIAIGTILKACRETNRLEITNQLGNVLKYDLVTPLLDLAHSYTRTDPELRMNAAWAVSYIPDDIIRAYYGGEGGPDDIALPAAVYEPRTVDVLRVQRGDPTLTSLQPFRSPIPILGGGANISNAGGGGGMWEDVPLLRGGFREVTEYLKDINGSPIGMLHVLGPRVWRDDLMEDAHQAFGRLVAALGRNEGGRVVQRIAFVGLNWGALPDDDVQQLLGEVLALHPTRENLMFIDDEGVIPVRCLSFLTSSLPVARRATPLQSLQILTPGLELESSRAIAEMIRRNVALTELRVRPDLDYLDSDNGRLVFEAATLNTNLQILRLHVDTIQDNTLDHVGASSSLRTLDIHSEQIPSQGSVVNFARDLRNNTTLTSLLVNGPPDTPLEDLVRLFRPIEEALETCNFTLTQVNVGGAWHQQKNVVNLLLRNHRLQQVLEHLEPRNYLDFPACLWPRLFGMVSAVPTLLYRSLRPGNVDALYRHLGGRGG
jgi:hypothetical protein